MPFLGISSATMWKMIEGKQVGVGDQLEAIPLARGGRGGVRKDRGSI